MTILSRLKRAKTLKTDVVTFERLDYWTMLELFDRIPVHDLVRLNGLAPWWSGYVDNVCLTKRSITVHCGPIPDSCITFKDPQDDFNLLKVTTIDSSTSDRLGRLLPNITSLEVYIGGNQLFTIDDITYLISQWSHQLEYLVFRCYSNFVPTEADNYDGNGQIYGLLLSLNCMTALTVLNITCDSSQCGLMGPIDLPILAQLNFFAFISGENDFINLRDSLVQYAAPNVALAEVWLTNFEWFDQMLDDQELQESLLLSKFRLVHMAQVNTRHEWALFPNLVFAEHQIIPNSRDTFIELISEMQPLERMTNLNLEIMISPEFDQNFGQVLPNMPQIHTVTNLQLWIFTWESPTNLYSVFKSLQLNTNMFPNVESVYLMYVYLEELPQTGGVVVKWMAKTWSKISVAISYRKIKRLVRRSFPGVECTFEQAIIETLL